MQADDWLLNEGASSWGLAIAGAVLGLFARGRAGQRLYSRQESSGLTSWTQRGLEALLYLGLQGGRKGAVSHLASPTEELRQLKGLPREAVKRRHVQSTCLRHA